ncbi:MAG: MFS transporter [Myxococcales bacterium]|nr:MFS transporter [Myxococcales bacterium]MCB9734046.1 MFS transporter [Deltaproteobacteria bacterium]
MTADAAPVAPPAPLDALVRRTMARSVVEGVLYAVMVGLGEVYFVADAIRLHASAVVVILVSTLPLFLGSLGSLGAVFLLRRLRHRRSLVVAAVVAQACVLAALAALDGAAEQGPTSLLVLACLYQAFGQAAGVAWSSWFGDVVPPAVRGDYFARRNRWVHSATFVGLFAGGLALAGLEPGDGRPGAGLGFALIFGAAAAFRLGSAALLLRSWEPPFAGVLREQRVVRFLRSADGASARRLLPLAAAFVFAVAVSSPFFAPFMLKELHFDYGVYMAAQAALVATKLVTLPGWGRAVDANGPRPVYTLAAVSVAVIPLVWIAADGVAVALVAQVLSGFAWGGYEVALFTLVLETTPARERPLAFAANAVMNGVGILAGGVLGTLLFTEAGLGYRWLFGVSFAGRLAIALAAPRVLRALGPAQTVGRRQLLLRMIGLRPNGGATMRPVEVTPEGEPPG